MNKSVGIVIPAYDPDINLLKNYINSLRQRLNPETIRIELDSPCENHVPVLEKIAKVNTSQNRRGKGAAIVSGFDNLKTDILAFADADGSVPVESVEDVIRPVKSGTAKLSISSRRHPSSEVIAHQTFVRRLLGDGFVFIAQKMLPTKCRDYQCGMKAIDRGAWENIGKHCYESGFAWDLELVSVAGSLGYDIIEVPITWEDHPNSTVKPILTPIELATALINIRRRVNIISSSSRYKDITKTEDQI
jgi:glycosyltransferase involved in cell wall biosynthesis